MFLYVFWPNIRTFPVGTHLHPVKRNLAERRVPNCPPPRPSPCPSLNSHSCGFTFRFAFRRHDRRWKPPGPPPRSLSPTDLYVQTCSKTIIPTRQVHTGTDLGRKGGRSTVLRRQDGSLCHIRQHTFHISRRTCVISPPDRVLLANGHPPSMNQITPTILLLSDYSRPKYLMARCYITITSPVLPYLTRVPLSRPAVSHRGTPSLPHCLEVLTVVHLSNTPTGRG